MLDMLKMAIDLFFLDTKDSGEVSGTALAF
jgi:hypothetical protein